MIIFVQKHWLFSSLALIKFIKPSPPSQDKLYSEICRVGSKKVILVFNIAQILAEFRIVAERNMFAEPLNN